MGADGIKSPVVALGLQAQAMVLAARHTRVAAADRLALLRLTLRHFADDQAVRAAVLDFEGLLVRDVRAAADRLAEFLEDFAARECPGAAPERHAWQDRADLQ